MAFSIRTDCLLILGCALSLIVPPSAPCALAERGTTKNGITEKSAPTTEPGLTDYCIGVGDILQIAVWKEPDISVPAITVRSDGKISVPLIKEVYVQGLTPTELEKILTEKLRPMVHEADVTVSVKQINSKKVYLLGAVRKEGAINLQGPTTVLQAISEAGGFNEYAKTKKVYILRRQNGKQVRIAYDYRSAIRGGGAQQEIMLEPGDTVVVPR